MRIVVASVQVPFVVGGAELLAQGLVGALRDAGHAADLVTLPFRFFPADAVERAMEAWEAEDFTQLNLYEPELVICLKFPAYGLAHPRKVAWLLHQHRSAYDLMPADAPPVERALAQRVAAFDRRHLGSCRRFTISPRVSARLAATTGLDSVPLAHPPFEAGKFYGADALPYILVPGRLEHGKRHDLLIRAMAQVHAPVGAVIVGDGGQQAALAALAAECGVAPRVRLVGRVPWDELRALYAHALAVFYGPLDEDYGYVTLEAMLSHKAVITCTDSGGPLEFVADGQTGRVVPPEPESIAATIDGLWQDRAQARRWGEAGHARYRALDLRWDRVVARLTEPA